MFPFNTRTETVRKIGILISDMQCHFSDKFLEQKGNKQLKRRE